MDITEIIERAGGVTKVARECGLTHPSVSVWTQVPPRHVLTVARLSNLTPHEIRPDIFGAPQEAA